MSWEELMKKDVTSGNLTMKLKRLFGGAEATWAATRDERLEHIDINSMFGQDKRLLSGDWDELTQDPKKHEEWTAAAEEVFERIYKNVKDQLKREFIEGWNKELIRTHHRRRQAAADADSYDDMV